MMLSERPASVHYTVLMQCNDCKMEYNGKVRTADKHIVEHGRHLCPKCVHTLVGRKVGAAQRETLREKMTGDYNPAKSLESRKKISASKKGKSFTDKHKQSLRKPKSNTTKIKEAANRPHEVERRRRYLVDRYIKNPSWLVSKNGIFCCNAGFVDCYKSVKGKL